MRKINLFLCVLLGAAIFFLPLAVMDTLEPQVQISTPQSSAPVKPSVSLSVPEAKTITPDLPQGDLFTIYDLSTGELHTLTAEEYTLCAVSAEMPPTFSEAALQAQAVASYTYALRAKLDNEKSPDPALCGADFAADPSNWKGFVTKTQYLERYGEETGSAYWEILKNAVEPVFGYAMFYQDRPIVAAFHSISCGKTEEASNVWSGSAPYLIPVESPGDRYAPGYETAEVFEPQALADAFISAGLIEASAVTNKPELWFSPASLTPSGYVVSVQFCGKPIRGTDIRNALGLRSACFTVEYLNDSFLIRVCGYGHGVGLSQYGAEYMAQQGSSWQEILEHYYTGIEICRPEN